MKLGIYNIIQTPKYHTQKPQSVPGSVSHPTTPLAAIHHHCLMSEGLSRSTVRLLAACLQRACECREHRCTVNVPGRMDREQRPVRVQHVEVLVARQEPAGELCSDGLQVGASA